MGHEIRAVFAAGAVKRHRLPRVQCVRTRAVQPGTAGWLLPGLIASDRAHRNLSSVDKMCNSRPFIFPFRCHMTVAKAWQSNSSGRFEARRLRSIE